MWKNNSQNLWTVFAGMGFNTSTKFWSSHLHRVPKLTWWSFEDPTVSDKNQSPVFFSLFLLIYCSPMCLFILQMCKSFFFLFVRIKKSGKRKNRSNLEWRLDPSDFSWEILLIYLGWDCGRLPSDPLLLPTCFNHHERQYDITLITNEAINLHIFYNNHSKSTGKRHIKTAHWFIWCTPSSTHTFSTFCSTNAHSLSCGTCSNHARMVKW